MFPSNNQKKAIEMITSKSWDSFSLEALEAYFAYTDRGKETPLFKRVWKLQLSNNEFTTIEQDLWDLMQCHTFYPVTVEMWKEGFLPDYERGFPPSLFLWDFYEWNTEGKLISPYPDAYLKHVFEIYLEARGYLPIDDQSLVKEWADHLGVKYSKELVNA